MDSKTKEQVEQLAAEFARNASSIGELNALVKTMMKSGIETMLNSELDHHLDQEQSEPASGSTPSKEKRNNCRNGHSSKKLKGDFGELEIETPRDRDSTFEPKIIEKHRRRIDGFDDKILALYAKGLTTRDIQQIVKDLYGVDVSPTLIASVTEDLEAELKTWQSRRLDPVCPIVYFDGIVVNVRGASAKVSPHTIYVALGINLDGKKELLGLWIAETEGAKFWLNCLTDLKNRGLSDIFVCCVDGLAGFPEAIRAAFPQARIQLCLVHLVRAALRYVSHEDSKAVAGDLKSIYRASTTEEAESELERFSEKWDKKYPTISRQWRNKWTDIITLFDFPPEIRKVIYTTNAIESVNSTIRKFTKNRKIYPSQDSATKLIYMAIMEASKRWTRPIKYWKQALNHFAILFEDRLPPSHRY
ncbi:IS256 family transposase [Planctomycetes bacterium TBK1r]|uniref:Mutator family transposase n=1 Tax=Stieleria magnilauensis TaxID=2527963 RepID=A0ABX5XIT1_9BACT|nr:Transposase, Mutator family [Planctomycetes bacterium TBK1r]QDV83180.1 Transposase, Mutator family [Planctomycetes bacterium TBK1r]QDV87210.1 Transposase, Mutator family [Planctomycetes bacterium TBK1r]QDV87603.1 Transposase, Mutator family [Planctomycetes bacterium TBK1r]QDV88809.1 Transposase, Mutator family [Planctomycetes bacterium TBK1r]